MPTPSLRINSVIRPIYKDRIQKAIFTSEKLDKSDDLVDAVKNLTINDAKYYESIIEAENDAQGNITRNPETVTHTSNGNETVTNTRNGNLNNKY